MKRSKWLLASAAAAGLVLIIGGLLYQIPSLKSRLNWRIETAIIYANAVLHPAGQMPTPDGNKPAPGAALPQPRLSYARLPSPTPLPEPTCSAQTCVTPTAEPSPTATPTPIPIPASASLVPPPYEKQDQNNCGPASLTMNLRYYGWKGDQYTITALIKPDLTDRNVNPDELLYFVNNRVGWLNGQYRVNGNIDMLKRFIALGMPIMVEEESRLDKQYWPNDDLWAGHYLMLTAYDDNTQVFTSQDSWLGANLKVSYQELDRRWQTFNRVYLMFYRPEQEETVRAIIGENWDEKTNRTLALAAAQKETEQNPENPFAWFNLGTNLDYFERYTEASQAFDVARQLGLPQRMLRYQFGPFIAYFRTGRIDDLLALTEYALKITSNSEENLLWHAWALYMKKQKDKAIEDLNKALKINPNYNDARYAINYMTAN
jgi:tetratricopeptide (TPR) repeat protein